MRTFVVLAVFGGGMAHATLGQALRIADVAPDIPLIVVVLDPKQGDSPYNSKMALQGGGSSITQ